MATPVASVLLILFAVSTLAIGNEEARVTNEAIIRWQNEGQYWADKAGVKLPGSPPPLPQTHSLSPKTIEFRKRLTAEFYAKKDEYSGIRQEAQP
jgi:hypothetical protein